MKLVPIRYLSNPSWGWRHENGLKKSDRRTGFWLYEAFGVYQDGFFVDARTDSYFSEFPMGAGMR